MFQNISIGWSGGNTLANRVVQHMDRVDFHGEKYKSVINHVFWRFDFWGDLPSLIYESHGRGGVQVTPYSELLDAKESGKVTRHIEKQIPIHPMGMRAVWDRCTNIHGKGYDFWLLFLYYIWIRSGRSEKPWYLKWQDKDRYTCNELVVSTGKDIIIEFDDIDTRWTPERLFLHFYGMPSQLYFADSDGLPIQDKLLREEYG